MQQILPIHQRMAELWTIRKSRPLTEEQVMELDLCLEANTNLVWEWIRIHNLSLLASKTKDYDWQHELCSRIEQLDNQKLQREEEA